MGLTLVGPLKGLIAWTRDKSRDKKLPIPRIALNTAQEHDTARRTSVAKMHSVYLVHRAQMRVLRHKLLPNWHAANARAKRKQLEEDHSELQEVFAEDGDSKDDHLPDSTNDFEASPGLNGRFASREAYGIRSPEQQGVMQRRSSLACLPGPDVYVLGNADAPSTADQDATTDGGDHDRTDGTSATSEYDIASHGRLLEVMLGYRDEDTAATDRARASRPQDEETTPTEPEDLSASGDFYAEHEEQGEVAEPEDPIASGDPYAEQGEVAEPIEPIESGALYAEHDEQLETADFDEQFHRGEEAETQGLDFESEQQIRDTQYVSFQYEAPEDYTAGPPRLVIASDGVQQCTSILLTFDLSQKIQDAAKMQRIYTKEARFAEAQLHELRSFRRKLGREIRSHEAKVSQQEQEEHSGETGADLSILAAAKEELSTLERMRHDFENRAIEVETNLATRADYLREAQEKVMACLDGAFVVGNLLAPQDEDEQPVETFDLQEEYQKHVTERLQQHAEEGHDSAEALEVLPLDISRDHLEAFDAPEPTAEDVLQREALVTLHNSRERFLQADREFDRKDDIRKQEAEANRTAWHYGEPAQDATPEDFDIRWFHLNRDHTRELAAAEEAYLQAKRAAAVLKIENWPFDDTMSDCFPQFSIDGDKGSEVDWTDEMHLLRETYCKDDPDVLRWLDDVPDPLREEIETVPEVELDDWDFKEPDMGDSWSCAEFGTHRQRIDKFVSDPHQFHHEPHAVWPRQSAQEAS